ncbi:MAG: PQQ-dependent sugar dehydrogenase [Thermoproteota archaeon]|nr:PQQ-dependent sugar dehydrogenase [Thermoproteota archaeon]
MLRKFQIVGIAGALIFSAVVLTDSLPSNPPPLPEPTINPTVTILATNFDKPWSIAFADEKIFISEKSGKIRVVTINQQITDDANSETISLLDSPLISLQTPEIFGGGLLGITTHPNFSNNHFLYAYYTYEENENLWNKIIRITEEDNKSAEVVTIMDKIPGSAFSNGGVIKFGPDGKLYVGTGSVTDSSDEPQNLNSLTGKILRLNDDGTIPSDNPFEESYVFSLGHRNPTGFAWNEQGLMYATESGPTKNDEINMIKAGSNYGWPEVQCFSNNENFVNPLECFDPGLEPGGIIFYSGDKLDIKNKMILASQKATILFKAEITENDVNLERILSGVGRIRDVGQGPDGYVYIITTNTDGKAFPAPDDDKLLRILN